MFLNADGRLTETGLISRCILMTVSVCLSVREHIYETTHPIFTKFLRSLPVCVRHITGNKDYYLLTYLLT